MKKKKQYRPWLSPTGVELPTEQLKEVSKTWSLRQWEEYLTWLETGRKDSLVSPVTYAVLGEEHTQSIFEIFDQNPSDEHKAQCEQALSILPELEALALREYFIEGKTERQIAFELHRSQKAICNIRNRALTRLKRGFQGDEVLTRRIMRGESFSCLWDSLSKVALKEPRRYEPDNQAKEMEKIAHPSVRAALCYLPKLQQQILYLRFWCELSISKTAQRLGVGVNTVQELERSAASNLKRNIVHHLTNKVPGGESCA